MADYREARGRSIRDREKTELNHLRIFGAPGATSAKPAWVVEHHVSARGDQNPEAHSFDDGIEMLKHVAASANVREGDE